MIRRNLYPIAVILAAFIFSAAVYDQLPDRMPVHWNWRGEVDGWGSRVVGAFVLPGFVVLLWGVLIALPQIDPRRENYARFAGTYKVVINALLTVLMLCHIVIVSHALGWPLSVTRIVPALFGGFLLVVGNVMPRTRSNWWFGVRTPWTMSSEQVWARTNRVAGYLLMAAGVALLLMAALPNSVTRAVAVVAFGGALVGSVVYSYWLWRKERAS